VTELWECIQAASLMLIVVGFALALWPLEWVLRRLGRWHERRQRRMAWLREPERDSRGHVVSVALLPDCLEPREPQRQDVPAAFRRAFGGE
jgi:hypothetical protein